MTMMVMMTSLRLGEEGWARIRALRRLRRRSSLLGGYVGSDAGERGGWW